MQQITIKCEVSTMTEAKEVVEAFQEIIKGLTSTAGPSVLEVFVRRRS